MTQICFSFLNTGRSIHLPSLVMYNEADLPSGASLLDMHNIDARFISLSPSFSFYSAPPKSHHIYWLSLSLVSLLLSSPAPPQLYHIFSLTHIQQLTSHSKQCSLVKLIHLYKGKKQDPFTNDINIRKHFRKSFCRSDI